MNWFKRHLNLTWGISCAIYFTILVFVELTSPIPFYVVWAFFIGITLWVLHQKGRGFGWVICPVACLFLTNKRQKPNVTMDKEE